MARSGDLHDKDTEGPSDTVPGIVGVGGFAPR